MYLVHERRDHKTFIANFLKITETISFNNLNIVLYYLYSKS